LLEQFEQEALERSERCDNANLALIELYLSDELAFAREEPEEEGAKERALELAEAELSRRGDVPTRAACAWAFQANGRLDEAREQIEKVLAVGVRDAKIFHRAGLIALAQGDAQAAQAYLREAASLEPRSRAGESASAALARILERNQG
jgi:Flp pilus assembly protein TadD